MSEKSTRNNLDYTVESRAARNRSVFRPEFQLCPCHTAEERYNPSKLGLKKDIPGNKLMGKRLQPTLTPKQQTSEPVDGMPVAAGWHIQLRSTADTNRAILSSSLRTLFETRF